MKEESLSSSGSIPEIGDLIYISFYGPAIFLGNAGGDIFPYAFYSFEDPTIIGYLTMLDVRDVRILARYSDAKG